MPSFAYLYNAFCDFMLNKYLYMYLCIFNMMNFLSMISFFPFKKREHFLTNIFPHQILLVQYSSGPHHHIFYSCFAINRSHIIQRWEFIKENKRVRIQSREHALDQESDQENKKKRKKTRSRPRKRPRKKRKNFFSWFLGRVLVFFYKFPPPDSCECEGMSR